MKKMDSPILIASTCVIDWGGSEELWGRAAGILREKGVPIVVYKNLINRDHPAFRKLSAAGVILEDWYSCFSVLARTYKRIRRQWDGLFDRRGRFLKDHTEEAFLQMIRKYHPSLVIIAQGINFDGLHYAGQCLRAGVPYAIISQKAVEFFWPDTRERKYMIPVLLAAKKCYFVSTHNRKLTEEQFGIRLPDSKIVYNPVKLRNELPFPSTDRGYRLACVARIWLIDKGQDILIRTLASEKWKERNIWVSFVGEGDDLDALRDMARLLGVTRVQFCGQQGDMEKVWMEHHALILPSRSEGLPLSMVEAMFAGRPVIVTNAGGNGELVEDGVTGFIGGIDDRSFGEAMERAWSRRSEWETIGRRAAGHVNRTVPPFPENDFANELLSLVYEK